METITDPAAIRATDDPDERTTPAPVGAAVALDLDGVTARAEWAQQAIGTASTAYRTVSEDVPVLVAEVRRLTESRSTVAANLAASLLRTEAEVRTLRARLAEAEALADQWADRKRSDGMSGNAWIGLTLSGVAADLRAALATTGEGE